MSSIGRKNIVGFVISHPFGGGTRAAHASKAFVHHAPEALGELHEPDLSQGAEPGSVFW